MKGYVGIGKTLFNSSCAYIIDQQSFEIFLTERLDRKKNSGAWPSEALKNIPSDLVIDRIAENSDVNDPSTKEEIFDRHFPFFDLIKKNKQQRFVKRFNSELQTIGHHQAHAHAAAFRSPFEKSLILVIDGAGSSTSFLRKIPEESHTIKSNIPDGLFEHVSLYSFEKKKITLLEKEFCAFIRSKKYPEHTFSNSVGIFYEKISEFIFNSKTSSGKVMGLAGFSDGEIVSDYPTFLEKLDWNQSFQGSNKKEWEQSPHLDHYKYLAATAQKSYEKIFLKLIEKIKKKYPDYKNIILAGGCALNCTANWLLHDKKSFDQIYVSPYPGDESIGLGCAAYLWFQENGNQWQLTPWRQQSSFFGSKKNDPIKTDISKIFSDYKVTWHENIAQVAAQELFCGEVIAWIQGRSESGPRSLGHRSLLASPMRTDLKNYLNTNIKFRESFRPYGCTVIWEEASDYFSISEKFENPFMSFAVPIRKEYIKKLKHIAHVDGTCRMQTLHAEADPKFYELLQEFKNVSGFPMLLNTSLNIMNEPILENLNDALRFFKSSTITTMIIGNNLIKKG